MTVKAEQIGIVYAGTVKNLSAGLVAGFLIASATQLWDLGNRHVWDQWAWFGALAVFLLRGIWMARDYAKEPRSHEDAIKRGRALVVNAALAATVWGLASWVLLPGLHLEGQAFAVIGIAMVLMGGTSSQAVYRPVVTAFTVPLTIVFVSGLLYLGGDFRFLLAAGFILFVPVLLMAAQLQESATKRAIQLRVEKASLLDRYQKLLRDKTQQERLAQNLWKEAEKAREQADRSRYEKERLLDEKTSQEQVVQKLWKEAERARQQAEESRYEKERLLAEQEQLLAEKTTQEQVVQRLWKEAENARVQAVMANQGKTAFLAAASHDLRQPLHALVQYFGHLRRANKDQDLVQTIERMEKSLDAIQDLLNTVLEMSKLMMGAVKPIIEVFSMHEVIDRLDAQLRPLAEAKGLALEMPSSDVALRSDTVLVERILRNLILNAIRYTDAGSVKVRCKVRKESVSLQVWDTGIGIPKDKIGLIFEEFYQVDNQARERRKGLGLGLSIVKQMCGLLHHRIRVRSTPGKGSVFIVELPLGDPMDIQPKHRSVAPDEAVDYVRGAFVVLIEDSRQAREAMAFTLRQFGCRVISASSGINAIELLQGQEFAPHIIVSDYRLKDGENGVEAVGMVRDNLRALFGDEFTIPALIVSGDTDQTELSRVREAGLAMLHKPVYPDKLRRAMNAHLKAKAESIGFDGAGQPGRS
jgi:signal transduction histidine kinase/CheY-like chemotaxis protein